MSCLLLNKRPDIYILKIFSSTKIVVYKEFMMVIPSKINYSPTSKSSLSTKIVVYKEFVMVIPSEINYSPTYRTPAPQWKKKLTLLFFVSIHMFILFFFLPCKYHTSERSLLGRTIYHVGRTMKNTILKKIRTRETTVTVQTKYMHPEQ